MRTIHGFRLPDAISASCPSQLRKDTRQRKRAHTTPMQFGGAAGREDSIRICTLVGTLPWTMHKSTMGYERMRLLTGCWHRPFELHQNCFLTMGPTCKTRYPLDPDRNPRERDLPRIRLRGGGSIPEMCLDISSSSHASMSSTFFGLATVNSGYEWVRIDAPILVLPINLATEVIVFHALHSDQTGYEPIRREPCTHHEQAAILAGPWLVVTLARHALGCERFRRVPLVGKMPKIPRKKLPTPTWASARPFVTHLDQGQQEKGSESEPFTYLRCRVRIWSWGRFFKSCRNPYVRLRCAKPNRD
jgi:hypothetical protein